MEHCASCGQDFSVVMRPEAESAPRWFFTCPYCEYRFEVENIPKIVWVLDEYSQMWHTTLVHKYVIPDNVRMRRFEYYD